MFAPAESMLTATKSALTTAESRLFRQSFDEQVKGIGPPTLMP